MLTKKGPKVSFILGADGGTFAERAARFALRAGGVKSTAVLSGWQVAAGLLTTIATCSLLLYALNKASLDLEKWTDRLAEMDATLKILENKKPLKRELLEFFASPEWAEAASLAEIAFAKNSNCSPPVLTNS